MSEVAVTKYKTIQVADDKWIYKAAETRVFSSHETIGDIVSWAEQGGNCHWADLVFSPIYNPVEKDHD